MRLYLVRHGEPEDGDEYETNPDPPLSEKGREVVGALAQWMLEKDEVPSVIWASPMLRTQETAEILREAFGLPTVDTKGSMGPQASIRKMVLKAAQDRSLTRVMLVSHHETLEHGLRVLNLEPRVHLDSFAMGELRIMKIRRKDGSWKGGGDNDDPYHRRIPPSDLGFADKY